MLKISEFTASRRVVICLVCFLCISCGKKKKAASPPPRPAVKVQEAPIPEVEKPEKYVYQGYKNRNPFFMIGGGSARAVSDADSVSADAAGFRLSGIMTDSSGVRYALMSDASGGSYILKSGWLYDVEGKRVPAVTGTVFDNRIIIISGTTMKELKLPEDDLPAKLE
ncbi:MAG: hypothetical protein ABII20_06530 [Candidatus Omnitrophota bacterium]|nr:pilus assembly protein PilP [Candidatus Omnitrophota bacterium]MBU2528262.1 hypothetical protein [bacterium]MBU3929639.1 hypothetical protein [bacterium]MBU4122123.1 hypothetical protein [bacterium]